ncbi:MAG TPA: hypothetical protein VJH03_01960 [Blastocatellia bacterium]|nr:hypothetical protein [Blastocatellia bacterium]
MNTVLNIEQPLVAEAVLPPISLEQLSSETSVEIVFPEFGCTFGGPVTVNGSRADSGHLTATARITGNCELVLEVASEGPEEMSCTAATIEIIYYPGERRAIDVFVASTLYALLGLSEKVALHLRMPRREVSASLSFDVSLPAISGFLQTRQLAYKVMVIERAVGHRFVMPECRSAEEIATIWFVYEAVIHRSFLWPDNHGGGVLILPASKEGLSELNELLRLRENGNLTFPPQPTNRVLFGEPLSLGIGTVTVLDASMERLDEVRAEIDRDDGHDVEVHIRSLTGQLRYDFPESPQMPPDERCDSNTQALIDIEPQLDAVLAERYNGLAAATLTGLTEEEKAQVTARLDWGSSFLAEPTHGDNVLWRLARRFLRFL